MNKQKKYWLGYDEPIAQDIYFIEALDKNIWSAGSKKDWDAAWLTEMPDSSEFEKLDKNKTLNHIPGNSALMIKSNLYTTLHKARTMLEGYPQAHRYDFFPKTYSMPEEYFDLQEAAADNPDWMWIQKPRNLSRGRGIEMVQHMETVPLDSSWIIQQYLHKPHLWDGYKYVLRCYILVTSVEPLRFYWYHEGSAKLTSEKFNLDDLDNPYRHLTNPDINENNDDVEIPVTFHSFKVYRQWLKDQGIDDEKLFDDLRDMLALTVIAARDKLRNQSQEYTADLQGTYELIGIDCMIDSNIKPWIVECNLSPSLEVCATNPEQAKKEIQTKKGMVTEIVDMLGLNDLDQETLSIHEKVQREMQRAKGFECIFPSEDANHYLNCFPVPRYADIASLPKNFNIDYEQLALQSPSNTEAIFEDSLALLTHNTLNKSSGFITPNEIATWIWIQISSGQKPEEIAAELTENFGPMANVDPEEGSQQSEQSWLAQIWEMLADWSEANLFNQANITSIYPTKEENNPEQKWRTAGYINFAGCSIKVRSACSFAEDYLRQFSDETPLSPENTLTVDIYRSSLGYVLTHNTQVLSGSRPLSRLMDDCIKLITRNILQDDDIALMHGCVFSNNEKNGILVGNQEQLDSLAYEICLNDDNYSIRSGSSIISSQANVVKCTDLPLLLPSNTTTLSSSYDASNYYPKKPQKQNSNKNDIVAKDWLISGIDSQPCWLAPSKGIIGELAQIQVIIFIETDDSADEANLSLLNNADLLAKLWPNCSQKKLTTAASIMEWIIGINGYSLKCQDLQQAKGLLTEVGNLLAK